MAFAPGESVGPYRIIEQLGQGGMASVFKAYHPALDRFVAIKVLHPAFKAEPNFLSRFQREARVVAKLEHPNIVPVYDFAEHKGQPYLVMKYIEGITLKARLNQGPLSKEDALQIVESVGKALKYAHARGVLHRDVKPSNILLSPDGAIYLADFGLARMAEAGASTLSKDVMLGTPQYISPEQAKGNIKLDEGTDIYSLGVVLYELVVGRVPFNADTPFSIIHDHIYTPLPLPRQINPNVPEVIERVLLKSLAKDPADRFKTVESMVQAFHSAVSEGRLPAGVETRVEPGKPKTPSPDLSEREIGQGDAPEQVQTDGSKVKKSAGSPRRWPWIVGGIVTTFTCLLIFLIAVGSAETENSPLPDAGNTGSDTITQAAQADVEEQDSESLDALTDPRLAYKRASQLAENERSVLAAQAFVRAGDLFLRQDAFIEAADSYLRALELDRILFEQQDEVVERFTQAAFLGATTEAIWPILDRIRVEAGDWPLLKVIEARTHLFVGDPDKTIPLLQDALRSEMFDPMARTVWAEFELKHGERDEAERLLDELLAEPDLNPQWLRVHIRNLRKGISEKD